MIRGDTNIKYLIENKCNIWTDDAYRYYKEKYSVEKFRKNEINYNGNQMKLPYNYDLSKERFIEKVLDEDYIQIYEPSQKNNWNYDHERDDKLDYIFGDLDRIYGQQWRNFNGKTDQLQNCINTLLSNPDDRRMIVTAHNPTDIEDENVGLPSCHNYFQFYTVLNEDGSRDLSTFVNIRSNDWFLGQPYNMAQYALLTHIIANIVGMGVGELVVNSVDAHLYHAHFDAAKIWMGRFEKIGNDHPAYGEQGVHVDPYEMWGCNAKLKLNHLDDIDNIKFEDIEITDYESLGFIKASLLT
jgi:thymidylate synthase